MNFTSIKKYIILILMGVFIFGGFLGSNALAGDNKTETKETEVEKMRKGGFGLTNTAQQSDLVAEGKEKTEGDILLIVGNVLNTLLGLLGILFLILIIYGGFLYMTAAGDKTQLEKGKHLITSAIIGLTIILAAYAITWFVTEQLATSPGVK